MKRLIIISCFFMYVSSSAQESQDSASGKKIAFKWSPTGLLVGNISLLGEYNPGGKGSFTGKIGIPITSRHSFDYQQENIDFAMQATSVMAGYRRYFRNKNFSGAYVEPYMKYLHHEADGQSAGTVYSGDTVRLEFSNRYSGFGVGGQLGWQFLIRKKFVVDIFLIGLEINAAHNKLVGVDKTANSVWTESTRQQIEQDVKDFINQFPFIKDNTTVVANKDTKTVTAEFNGIIPGYRAGISIGIAF